jgi:four helix bundle protein
VQGAVRGAWGARCGVLVPSAECRVPGAGCAVRSAECGVRSAECGIEFARQSDMGAKDFTELRAWQLARRLKVEVDRAILAKPAAQAHRKFHEQLSDAVRSAPRNLAEGFGRYAHREFAHFTRIALASLKEVQNHILDAKDQALLDDEEHDRLWKLSNEAVASTTALLKYLAGKKRG